MNNLQSTNMVPFSQLLEKLKDKNSNIITVIRHLRIQNNELKSLSDILKENYILQILDLSISKIDDNGVIYLTDLIRVNRTLLQINLSYNYITDKGARILYQALRDNLTLVTFDLWCNKIEDKSIYYQIFRILKRNRDLPNRKNKFLIWLYCLGDSNSFIPLELRILIWEKLIYIF